MCLLIRIAILLIFVSSVLFTSGQQLFGEEIKNRLDIAKTAIARLEKKTKMLGPIDIEMERANSLYMKWKEEPNDSSWRALMFEITSVSERKRVGSNVTIRTVKDNNPQGGATIKYRLTDREEIKTAKSPTTTTEYFLPIGYYYIWSERKGRETSDKKSNYVIIKQMEEVTINEYE